MSGKTWTYNVICTKVTDGDTIVVENFDMGMGIYLDKVSCRLFGLNTPESRTKNLAEKKRGLEAKMIVKNLIEGKMIKIETIEREKFGRWLVRVWIGNLCVNDFLLKEKLALPYFGIGKKPI